MDGRDSDGCTKRNTYTMKIKRTGKSFNYTPANCPKHLILTLGFTEEQTERMTKARRILPFVERRTTPCIDARKLWEQIGKPYGQFNKWVEQSVESILVEFLQNGEVVESKTQTGRRPRTDYTISRDCAAHLAMNTRTPEGKAIRSYLLDMEELAVKLLKHAPIRGSMLANIDNQVAHWAFVTTGNKAKAGELPKSLIKQEALRIEMKLKSAVCRAMTGLSAGEWKAKVGHSIRDTLCTEDLNRYSLAYASTLAMLAANMAPEQIEKILSFGFGNSIQVDDYICESHQEVA